MDLLTIAHVAATNASAIHRGSSTVHLISSPCTFYHYLCDDTDDRGWGCGYRSLQSLCSWAVMKRRKVTATGEGSSSSCSSCDGGDMVRGVPSVREIQRALVEISDKEADFAGSREWIGCFEACLVLDHLCSVPCKIVHVSSGTEVVNYVKTLVEHFDTIGSPVMIGGDVDGASKTLVGVQVDQSQLNATQFLVADPHYICSGGSGSVNSAVGLSRRDASTSKDKDVTTRHTATVPDRATYPCDTGVLWHDLGLFQAASFYNFCLPQDPIYSSPIIYTRPY